MRFDEFLRCIFTSVPGAYRHLVVSYDLAGQTSRLWCPKPTLQRISNKSFYPGKNGESTEIEIEAAKSGDVSDPRNAALIKKIYLVNIGERAGSGIPNIYAVWKKQGWKLP